MNRFISIGKAAAALGISTLRRWEKEGKIMPSRTALGHRRYDISALISQRDQILIHSTTTCLPSLNQQLANSVTAVISRQSFHLTE